MKKKWKIFEKIEKYLKNICKTSQNDWKTGKTHFLHFCKYFTVFIFLQNFCKFAISGYNLWESWKIAKTLGNLRKFWNIFETFLKKIEKYNILDYDMIQSDIISYYIIISHINIIYKIYYNTIYIYITSIVYYILYIIYISYIMFHILYIIYDIL